MDNVIKGIGSLNKAHTTSNSSENFNQLQNQGSKQALKSQTQLIQRNIDHINSNSDNNSATTTMSETNSNKSNFTNTSNFSATPYGYERINKSNNPIFKPIAAKVYKTYIEIILFTHLKI